MIRKLLIGLSAVVIGVIGIVVVLANENALVVHPRGVVAQGELQLIIINTLLMLVIIIPTYIFLFSIIWKYCVKNTHAKYDPEHSFGAMGELCMWGLPTVIVIILSIVTWEATHRLNPYKPLESEEKPLLVQVIAMDWKWLFIYPELEIATLNYLHIPEGTPIHFRLTADGSPMNSFWIPQLSGQIYSMTGMSTQLHLKADASGEFVGRAVEINGEGYAGMTFPVKATSLKDFKEWVALVKTSPIHLSYDVYNELVKPAVNQSVVFYAKVEKDLYNRIVQQYMYPTDRLLWKRSS